MKVGLLNAFLRTSGLGARFLLALFMARYMSLHDVGLFALLAGATGLLPAAAGFGLNFFLARSLVGKDHEDAARLARGRLTISVLSGIVYSVALLAADWAGAITLPIPAWLAVAILLLELAGFDMQTALLARSRSGLANLLLFLRSGAWALPFMILAWMMPEYRTIGTLCHFWLAGIACAHLATAWRFRRDYRVNLVRLVEEARAFVAVPGLGASRIWLSDIGISGSVYLDRFIISSLDGVRSAGIYFFYASIVNAVYVIGLSATVQVYQPQLRAAFMAGGIARLRETLRHRLASTAMVGAAVLAASGPAAYAAARFSGKGEIQAAFDIIPILLAAYGVRMLSDLMSVVLAAAERDRDYAIFNMAGLGLSIGGCLILVPILGIRGAALASLSAALVLLMLRLNSWRRFERLSLEGAH